MNDELFDLVNEQNQVIGQARRSEVHGNPDMLHRVVHVLIFNSRGQLFLQKRSEDKDVQPGKWDTSVGGHVDSGETVQAAARRELAEELGIPDTRGTSPETGPELRFLHSYIHRNSWESELVSTWMGLWDGPFSLQKTEISDGGFWDLEEIDLLAASSGDNHPFTPNFLDELRRWREKGAPLP